MAVDGEHQIIVATQVGPQASDQGQLVGMLDEINETFGVEPAVVLADAGYCNEPDLLELEDRGIDAHVALGREGKSIWQPLSKQALFALPMFTRQLVAGWQGSPTYGI